MWVSLGFLLLSGNVLLLVRAIDVEAHAAHINIGMADETRISILIKCQVPVSLVPEVMVVADQLYHFSFFFEKESK